jgi:hypothetical protein
MTPSNFLLANKVCLFKQTRPTKKPDKLRRGFIQSDQNNFPEHGLPSRATPKDRERGEFTMEFREMGKWPTGGGPSTALHRPWPVDYGPVGGPPAGTQASCVDPGGVWQVPPTAWPFGALNEQAALRARFAQALIASSGGPPPAWPPCG